VSGCEVAAGTYIVITLLVNKDANVTSSKFENMGSLSLKCLSEEDRWMTKFKDH
jgi:hypothetical protein